MGCGEGKTEVIIDNEDTKKPLNDDEIVAKLKEQGIDLCVANGCEVPKILTSPSAATKTILGIYPPRQHSVD